jgi:RNA polymerase sigma-70 factor, ECF subfamily
MVTYGRDQLLSGGQMVVKSRPADEHDGLGRLRAKVGEPAMENGQLRERVRRAEGTRLSGGGGRGDGPARCPLHGSVHRPGPPHLQGGRHPRVAHRARRPSDAGHLMITSPVSANSGAVHPAHIVAHMLTIEWQPTAPAIGRYTPPHDRLEVARSVVTPLSGDGERGPADEELAERVARREVAALEALYERHGRVLFSLAVKMLDDPQAAEDIVQETFLKLWQRPETYVPQRGRLRSWLLGVAHHRTVDRLRRRRLELSHSADPADLDVPASPRDTFHEVFAGLRGEAVARALKTLPAAQCRAVELAFLDGLTHTEIAAALGEPLGTIKTRLRLALQKLRMSPELADLWPDA